ncbi:uncharacterized protein LOC129724367 isoform X2 [Wyeomyia smithii]|uniref:uncharacterized protein LOC129724367 isoform X2 n=1 Tax=Wyeomyia smithii TaxID=174621 RepID=UPI002467C5D0|nr:uncharacterized protein LOC129724367 isoform X2 [Wyeomyia smithii]
MLPQKINSKGKRSSILKKRPSVGLGSTESSPSETTGLQKTAKRIGFNPKKSVKEFFATDETATVWCNSYELSADGTPPHFTINETTLKDDTKTELSQSTLVGNCGPDKENVIETRGISPNNSSIWNLSLSGCEEERRRLKCDTTVNSSVLNATERLIQEPTAPKARMALRPKQVDIFTDSIAMDVSPVKCDGKTGSPRKTIYFHPKENMFVTIDDVVPVANQNPAKSLNDTDIYFAPEGNFPSGSKANDSRSSKILFQISNTSIPWRNRSIQTEPRPSLVAPDKQSVAVNADLSAGWSSHVAGPGDSWISRKTFGNSQFDISEAWNSHPAAALKLKLLQQASSPGQSGQPFSDEGGGIGTIEDADSTIAITRTVAKMLGPGSAPISLESTRYGEVDDMVNNIHQEAMETSFEADHNGKCASVNITAFPEESITDVKIPSNALSRSRPSINPSIIFLDESVYPSQEMIVSSHGRTSQTRKPKLAVTSRSNAFDVQDDINQGVAGNNITLFDVSSIGKTLPPLHGYRRTILDEETIITDDQLLKSAATASELPSPRHTSYDVGNENRKPPRQTTYDGFEMDETNLDKENLKPQRYTTYDCIAMDESNANKENRKLPRETTYDNCQMDVSNANRENHKPSRQTTYGGFEMDESKVDKENLKLPRQTIYDCIAMDESNVNKQNYEAPRQTIYGNFEMDESNAENYKPPIQAIHNNFEIYESSVNKDNLKPPRQTLYDGLEMDETNMNKENLKPPRQTTYNCDTMDESNANKENYKAPRQTIYDNFGMDESNVDKENYTPPTQAIHDKFEIYESNVTKENLKPPRQTFYDGLEMDDTNVNKENHKPLIKMEEVRLDLPDLVFARNSVGLDLVPEAAPQLESGRPKIHRIPPRVLNHNFGSTTENVEKKSIEIFVDYPDQPELQSKKLVTLKTIDLTNDDSPPKQSEESRGQVQPRGTIHHPDMAIDLTGEDENIAQSVMRRTDHRQLDITTASSSNTQHLINNVTLESLPTKKQVRSTILVDEQMELSPVERRTGASRKTIVCNELVKPDANTLEKPQPQLKTEIYDSIDLTQDDNPEEQVPESSKQHPRETIYQDYTIDVTCRDKNVAQSSPSRRTNCLQPDISMGSPMFTSSRIKRDTILTTGIMENDEDLVTLPVNKHLQPTILCDEPLELCPMEPRTGSLEDLRKIQTRKTIVVDETMEFVPASPPVSQKCTPPNNSRKTMLQVVDMEQSPPIKNKPSGKAVGASRLTVMVPQNMDESSEDISSTNANLENMMHQRKTICLATDMEQSPKEVSVQKFRQNYRETILNRESMDQTLSSNARPGISQSPKHSSQRVTTYDVEGIDETRCINRTASPLLHSSKHNEHTRSPAAQRLSNLGLKSEEMILQPPIRQTCFTVQDMDQSNTPAVQTEDVNIAGKQIRQTLFEPIDMEDTIASPHHRLEMSIRFSEEKLRDKQSTAIIKLSDFRPTTYAAENMDETLCEPIQENCATLQKIVQRSSRRTNAEPYDMEQSFRAVSNRCDSMTSKMLQSSPLRNASKVDQKLMNSTRPSIVHTAHLEQPNVDESLKLQVSKQSPASRQTLCNRSCQTSFNVTGFEKSNINQSRPVVNENDKPEESCHKTRRTVFPADDVDETCLSRHLGAVDSSNMNLCANVTSNKARQTIFPRDDMEQTTVDIQQYCKPVLKNRQTLLIEDNMNETLLRQQSVKFNGTVLPTETTMRIAEDVEEKANVENPTNEQIKIVNRMSSKVRQTIFPRDDMEQTTVDIQQYCKPLLKNRQTMLVEDNMNETLPRQKSVKFNGEMQPIETDSCQNGNVEEEDMVKHPTNKHLETEQQSTSTNRSTRKILTESCDMDHSMLVNSMNVSVIKSPKSLKPAVQSRKFIDIRDNADDQSDSAIDVATPLEAQRDGLEPAAAKELRPSSFAIPMETITSVELKELNEPSFSQPTSLAVSVIQETPKKAGPMPVRRSRGTIFDRMSMELDESGPIQCEQPHVESENEEDKPVSGAKIATENVRKGIEQLITNGHDSSEEEFYDAEAEQVEQIPKVAERPVHVACEEKRILNGEICGYLQSNQTQHKPDQTMNVSMSDQTSVNLKTLNFVDVDELEQTTNPAQKRQLSRISKSVLQELKQDPLNVSISEDYPMKKRKTSIRSRSPVAPDDETKHTASDEIPEQRREPRKSMKRVTFHQSVAQSPKVEENIRSSMESAEVVVPEIETVTIKKEQDTRVENYESNAEQSRMGFTMLTDPSVFIVEESDMLANESNVSLVSSPNVPDASSRHCTLKVEDTFYNEYAHLTVNVDQEDSVDCVTISDDSVTEPAQTPATIVAEKKPLKLSDLSEQIMKTRPSIELNSTVASEIMYELRQQAIEAKKPCCSFRNNCRCRERRTVATAKRDNISEISASWRSNFDRMLGMVVDIPPFDLPLNDRLQEIMNRPAPALSLPCLEQQAAHLMTTPSILGPCEISRRVVPFRDASRKVFNACNLPRTPSVMILLANKLKSERYRWFLDATNECRTYLTLRHTVLRTVQFKVSLQKPLPWYGNDDDVRITGLECMQCVERLIPSPRLLLAHNEFMLIVQQTNLTQLISHCLSLAKLISLVNQLNALVEQALRRVDQLYRIVRNNGALLEILGDSSRLRVFTVYEYERDEAIHWNRASVQFDTIDRIDRSCVSFHKNSPHEDALFPTEPQCGRAGARGLVFLECLLWNIEKSSIDS